MNYKAKSNAFDCETVHGYARLVCTPYKAIFVYSFTDVIDFLISQGDIYGKQFFTFNITYDANSILKYLPVDILTELHKEHEVTYDNYKIRYIKSKFLRIWKGKQTITVYDIAQFFGGSLDFNAKLFLNDKKKETVVIANIKTHQNDWTISQMEDYFIKNKDILIEYCMHDALLTAKLADLTKKKVRDIFGITLQSFTSKAKIGEMLTLKHVIYPKYNQKSMAANYAFASYGGGLFDIWQRGEFEIVSDLDISSAYPAFQMDLPHWSNGSFIPINDEKELHKYKYGWLLCEFDCFYIPHKNKEYETWKEIWDGKDVTNILEHEKVYYPTGKRMKIITLCEYNFMKKYNFYVKMNEGYVWEQTKNQYRKPFGWMKKVYEKKKELVIKHGSKKEAKKDYAYPLIKIALNGTYGKTVQRVGQARMQNFFYGSYITAPTRIQVAEYIEDNNLRDRVILIATDGLLITGKAPDLNYSTDLGNWEKDEYKSAIVLANGVYQLFNEDGSFSTKMRGYRVPNTFDLKTFLQHHSYQKEILITPKLSPITLFQGIGYKNIYIKDDINVFKSRGRYLKTESNLTKKWNNINNLGDFLGKQHIGKRFTVRELENDKNKMP